VERLGLLFPVGGRVAPEQMIGREGDVAELVERLDEAMHATMSGRRRIGKTTVCHAACARLREQHGFLVVELEAPEQSTAAGFCQLLIDCSGRVDRARAVRRFGRTVRPFVEEQLKELGIPSEERLERILAFGDGYPYATMAAALYTAFNARRLKLGEIDDFVLDRGLEEARERLAADA
jgi:hypothetical protein